MPRPERTPLRAVLLSILAPGLGQLYTGRLFAGLLWLGATSALGPLAALGVRAAPAQGLTWLGLGALAWVGLLLSSAVAAAQGALRDDHPAPPRELDRGYVYVLLALWIVPSLLTWVVTLRDEAITAYAIPSGSMQPTIPPGARVLVDRSAYRRSPVCRGDIVVFPNPDRPHQTFIKRVLALPGDTVELRDGVPYVNGTPATPTTGGALGEGAQRSGASLREGAAPTTRWTVPHGHCFVLGDDRAHSVGSPEFGPVPLASLLGRVRWMWSPRWQRLPGGECGGAD